MKLLIEECAAAGYSMDQILNYSDNERCNPLHCAVIGGDAGTIELFLR